MTQRPRAQRAETREPMPQGAVTHGGGIQGRPVVEAARASGLLPADLSLRVVGDVHGDFAAFRHAAASGRFVVQLGDLTDYGPDPQGVLTLMFDLIDQDRGLFLLGNHDLKLARMLSGRGRDDPATAETIARLDEATRARFVVEAARAPGWLRRGGILLVHGGFHPAMLNAPPPAHGLTRPTGTLSRALFGQPTGRMQPDGYPERSIRWIDQIPPGVTVCCGHDQRSRDGRPWVRDGLAGGKAVFLDTGAGKGGHLSWIDL